MKEKKKKRRLSGGTKAFIKAFVLTVSAIALVVIGYFTAGYFFGGL